MMTLDPSWYACPTHGIDLTDQVSQQLDDEDEAPVAFGGKGRRGGRSEFEVVVSCPGEAGVGTAHRLTCRGTFQR
jgi:hypothetical protein